MGLLLSTRRALLGAVETYNDKIMRTSPVAYWPQNETAGTAAVCLTNTAMNGTYTGVTLANDNTGPFGTPTPYYDGTNDDTNIHSLALQGALDNDEGSLLIWVRAVNAGMWTDGSVRVQVNLGTVAPSDTITISGAAVNNRCDYQRSGNNNLKQVQQVGFSSVGWIAMGLTWSITADQLIAYKNGAQVGATQTLLTPESGAALRNTHCCIGSDSTGHVQVWHGWLGPCAIWDRALPLAEIAALALV